MAQAIGPVGGLYGQVDRSTLFAVLEPSENGRGHCRTEVCARYHLFFSSAAAKASSSSLVTISASTVSSLTGGDTRGAVSKGKLGSAHAALAYYSHHQAVRNIDHDSCTCCLGVFTEFCARCCRHPFHYGGRRAVGCSNYEVSVNPLSSNWRHANGGAREIGLLRSNERPGLKSANRDHRSSKTQEIVSSGDLEPEEIAWDKSLANSVHLIGRAGHDVDIKYLDTGKIVANLRLAVKRLGAPGQNPEPDWVVLELWGDLAETAANFVQKGRVIYVSGRLAVDTWTDRDTGKKQYATKVVVSALKFIAASSDSTSREDGVRRSSGMMGGTRTLMPSSPMSEAGAGAGYSSLSSLPLSSPSSVSSPAKSGSRWQGGGWSSASPSSPSPSVSASSSSTSTWSAMASAQEQQWKTFFADPDSWWDNRIGKRNPRAPDFKHKETKQSLWLGGRGTPAWVADRVAAWDRAKEDASVANREAGVAAGGGLYKELHETEVADGREGVEEEDGDDDELPSSEDEGLLGGGMRKWERKMEYNAVSNGGPLVERGRGHGLFSDQDFDDIAF
ncbi:hypothetical protein CBR_g19562 [Chara braunii]|uniref:Single-stranded DNA-binding protein n=1 Tax=Chara braunii TaxID=69332 RepID=A0A388KYB9_CHABU|nr:hypothetical protein CBR_g19562 [Chara braunii]|eukprot:GBG75049.1 hypothetical protein CBR_g19562 [Chara braunii]